MDRRPREAASVSTATSSAPRRSPSCLDVRRLRGQIPEAWSWISSALNEARGAREAVARARHCRLERSTRSASTVEQPAVSRGWRTGLFGGAARSPRPSVRGRTSELMGPATSPASSDLVPRCALPASTALVGKLGRVGIAVGRLVHDGQVVDGPERRVVQFVLERVARARPRGGCVLLPDGSASRRGATCS